MGFLLVDGIFVLDVLPLFLFRETRKKKIESAHAITYNDCRCLFTKQEARRSRQRPGKQGTPKPAPKTHPLVDAIPDAVGGGIESDLKRERRDEHGGDEDRVTPDEGVVE